MANERIMNVSVIHIGIVDGKSAVMNTHKEECDAASMRRGARLLDREPSNHGQEKESGKESKESRKEEEEVISTS